MLASSAATSAAHTPVASPRELPKKSVQRDSLSEDDRGLLQKALERIEFLEGQLSSSERASPHESVQPSPKSSPKKVNKPDPKGSKSTGEPVEDDTIVTPDGKAVPWSQKNILVYIFFGSPHVFIYTIYIYIYHIKVTRTLILYLPLTSPYTFLRLAYVYKVLGADALRMRLRRLCERKASGKSHVDTQTFDDYKAGGARREALEIALCEAIQKHGSQKSSYNKVKARVGPNIGPLLFHKRVCFGKTNEDNWNTM